MAESDISKLVGKRDYSSLESVAESFIKRNDWQGFVSKVYPSSYRYEGKGRDAIVHLLQLESVGGTDTDVGKEFGGLDGNSLEEVRLNALDHAIDLLRDQIENRHTYFADVEAMAASPFAILVEDVLAARRKELKALEPGASRIDVLGTYYGFTILMAEGGKPWEAPQTSTAGYYSYRRYRRRRTWLDETINEEAALAIRNITGEFAKEVDMDRTYKTLGSSRIFRSRCSEPAATILENAVRLSLYKAPTHRRQGARALGRTQDSRALPFLHNRMLAELNDKTSVTIAQALGDIGDSSSASVILQRVSSANRYSKALVEMVTPLGDIDAPETKEVLLDLLKSRVNAVQAEAIGCLARLGPPDLIEVVAPHLKDSSKPIVRQSVLALADQGAAGVEALTAQMAHILKAIGNDRPSTHAMEKLMAAEGIGQRSDVQSHFAKKLQKETAALNKWINQIQTSSYRYYYSRYLQRTKRQLESTVLSVGKYMKPPHQNDLATELRNARAALKSIP